ncbi:hypothetical protein AVEN_22075-1 [Araneus ventricosus]|uniref:Uncharacterized protein n=1 Tax=Araneus ventricosus TaxID=182803 RepID=A0A4Y2GUY0_ARAVE|nr:hypothetical protein AVEN_22075-1 [Araneus ventricosus]
MQDLKIGNRVTRLAFFLGAQPYEVAESLLHGEVSEEQDTQALFLKNLTPELHACKALCRVAFIKVEVPLLTAVPEKRLHCTVFRDNRVFLSSHLLCMTSQISCLDTLDVGVRHGFFIRVPEKMDFNN